METIQELIKFVEAIPEDQWIGFAFEQSKEGVTRRCIAGHINHAIVGEAVQVINQDEPATVLLKKLNIDRGTLVSINNNASKYDQNIKTEVLTYLKIQDAA